MHSVFHITLLEPFRENTIPGRQEPPEPPVGDDLDFYVVAEIIDSQKVNRRVRYLVKWEGYGRDEMTWELYEHLANNAIDLLKDFHEKYLEKPRDKRLKRAL